MSRRLNARFNALRWYFCKPLIGLSNEHIESMFQDIEASPCTGSPYDIYPCPGPVYTRRSFTSDDYELLCERCWSVSIGYFAGCFEVGDDWE